MALRIKEFPTLREAEDFLNDRIIGGTPIDPISGINVRNLTLIFTTPAGTVTFPDTTAFESTGPAQIVDEINTQLGTLSAAIRQYGHGRGGRDGRIALVRAGDVFTGGTAAAVLKLVAGTVGADAITLADFGSLTPSPQSSSYCIVFNQ